MEDHPARLRRVQQLCADLPVAWMADQAGLSVSTVEAVLRGDHVSEALLRRIESLLIRIEMGQLALPDDANST